MLTVIITTFNRPDFLNRLLSYFCKAKLKYQIYIGDASGPDCLIKNKKIINSFSRGLKINHLIWDSSKHVYEVMFGCLQQVGTSYVVCMADDDFIIPAALDEAVEFINNNPSYEAVQGKQIYFTDIWNFHPLNMVDSSVKGDCAIERIRIRMAQNTRFIAPKTVYSVMRTKNAIRLYREILSLGLDGSNTEALMNQMILVSGNIKLLNRLYIARQYHDSNQAERSHYSYVPIVSHGNKKTLPLEDLLRKEKQQQHPDYFDLLVDPLFHIKYEKKLNCLANELSKQDGICLDSAKEVIKSWEWKYLAKNLMSKFYEHGRHQAPTNLIIKICQNMSKLLLKIMLGFKSSLLYFYPDFLLIRSTVMEYFKETHE